MDAATSGRTRRPAPTITVKGAAARTWRWKS
jgi:hypothetical protein